MRRLERSGCGERFSAKHGRVRRCERAICAWRDKIGRAIGGESCTLMRAWALQRRISKISSSIFLSRPRFGPHCMHNGNFRADEFLPGGWGGLDGWRRPVPYRSARQMVASPQSYSRASAAIVSPADSAMRRRWLGSRAALVHVEKPSFVFVVTPESPHLASQNRRATCVVFARSEIQRHEPLRRRRLR